MKAYPGIILILIGYAHGVLDCCFDPNVIEKGRCKNGNKTALSCPKKYILRPSTNESFSVVEDQLIFDDNFIVPPTRLVSFRIKKSMNKLRKFHCMLLLFVFPIVSCQSLHNLLFCIVRYMAITTFVLLGRYWVSYNFFQQ